MFDISYQNLQGRFKTFPQGGKNGVMGNEGFTVNFQLILL